ncbi:MAG: aminotransferase class III-fold pyridoxal phosphate-dependent enzyme [Crenarchaeota archaeon]|nr:MAG: aminotransferase class III-fold pyridoxal phosphate-dependent enzyme [Thermoproteota archaeon]RDJ32966.1 MAG: aminotransferase class III-fold pyridoxal phosphate-dependent enzyme [Thermoproteota archaeon]RDJ35855.1 MAG: aminotransferase class III-fold pyridoxal phosphate-dependent enzyme [Thermoproteota archaeon]RDJ36529.1 MAG: aminotransferase class III-fold pyridoxal phosphate-dependent enzyme [Thermoproteota archaeon]
MTEDDFMGSLYQRFPVTIEKGLGSHVWDTNGKEYVDCMGGYGVALVGHRNERVVNAIKSQLDKIITVHSSLYNKTREEFLETLMKQTPKGLSQVHLNNSGAEAIEAAIKFARKFTGKKGMVAMKGSYHGKSMGALSLTFNPKYRKMFEPLVEQVSFSSFGDINELRSTINEDTGFVIMEPIQGESGIHVAPDGFLEDVRKLCDEKGILLIFDEIQAGLGRTGRMWASEHWNTTPDIMCLAKGIAGGVPMGATLVKPEILSCMSKGEHSSTFGGNPLSCAAGIGTIHALTQDGLIKNAEKNGEKFIDGLKKLQEKHDIIREVRGKGLMIGVELKFEVKDILMEGIKEGILLLYSGRNILRLLPPLVISEEDITKVLDTLDVLLTREEERRNV